MTNQGNLTMNDLVDIVKYGDGRGVDEKHEELQRLINSLSPNTVKALLSRATYAIDMFQNMPDEEE